ASPCGGGCFSIEHLQVDLTRALALGLRFRSAKRDVGGNDAFEACERLRDRAVALLTEWRMATRKDAVPAAIQDSLGPAGCREWAATEAALFLLSISAPRICRNGTPAEVELLLRELERLPATLRLHTPTQWEAVQLRAIVAVLVRKGAGAFARTVSGSGRVGAELQAAAVRAAVTSLASQDFLAPLSVVKAEDTSGPRALQLGAAALSAAARDGAWLDPPGVLGCLRAQLDSRVGIGQVGVWPLDCDGTFVRAYCSILAELPADGEAGALAGLEALCAPLAGNATAAASSDQLRALTLLLTATRVAPPSWRGEPCAVALLAEVRNCLVKDGAPEALASDALAVVTAHSEVPSVRDASIGGGALQSGAKTLGPQSGGSSLRGLRRGRAVSACTWPFARGAPKLRCACAGHRWLWLRNTVRGAQARSVECVLRLAGGCTRGDASAGGGGASLGAAGPCRAAGGREPGGCSQRSGPRDGSSHGGARPADARVHSLHLGWIPSCPRRLDADLVLRATCAEGHPDCVLRFVWSCAAGIADFAAALRNILSSVPSVSCPVKQGFQQLCEAVAAGSLGAAELARGFADLAETAASARCA
ncbi:unnamed protein product, partial [Polarella glacialis]